MTRLYYWQNETKNEEKKPVATSSTPLVNKELLKEIEDLKSQLVYKENVIESLKKQFTPNFNLISSTNTNFARSDIIQWSNDFIDDLRDLISVVSGLKPINITL